MSVTTLHSRQEIRLVLPSLSSHRGLYTVMTIIYRKPASGAFAAMIMLMQFIIACWDKKLPCHRHTLTRIPYDFELRTTFHK